MNVAAIILRGESLYCRVPLGMLRDLPRAARTVYEAIHYLARRNPLQRGLIAKICHSF